MAPLQLKPEQAARLEANLKLSARKPKTAPAKTSPTRKREALKLYRQSGSKGLVCRELHMSRNTLNKILKASVVV
jgi:hypothetical protein